MKVGTTRASESDSPVLKFRNWLVALSIRKE